MSTPTASLVSLRPQVRRRLLVARVDFASSSAAPAAQASMARQLQALIATLEPQCLGLYWPIRSEFNAPVALASDDPRAMLPLALPFVRREPPEMHYRAWDGKVPALLDEARIPASDGATVVPDVVLVPCVGFTPAGFRLGYGGGFFDRWMAAHPQVTTVGIAWAFTELQRTEFEAQPHDLALSLVLTEQGVVAGPG